MMWPLSSASSQHDLWWYSSHRVLTKRGRRDDQKQVSAFPSSHGGPYSVRSQELCILPHEIHENGEWRSIPGSEPRLYRHRQTAAPFSMFLCASREETPLSMQLLRQGSDVIGFKPAAATDVTDTSIIGLPGIFLHVPSGQYPGLQTCHSTYWWITIFNNSEFYSFWDYTYQRGIQEGQWSPGSCNQGCGKPVAGTCNEPWAQPSPHLPSSSSQSSRRSPGQNDSWCPQSELLSNTDHGSLVLLFLTVPKSVKEWLKTFLENLNHCFYLRTPFIFGHRLGADWISVSNVSAINV